MGYTTEFEGKIEIVPALPQDLIEYINKFSETRRMRRNVVILKDKYNGKFSFNGNYGEEGEYFIGGLGLKGQDRDNTIVDYNEPPKTQPGLWCKWEITEDGKYIQWDGLEKFYYADIWMRYIINNFISNDYSCNGIISAQGEESDDQWDLIVENNKVRIES